MIIDSSQLQLSAEHHQLEIREQSRTRSGFLLAFDAARVRVSQARLDALSAGGGLIRELASPRAAPFGPPGLLSHAELWGESGRLPGAGAAGRSVPAFASDALAIADGGTSPAGQSKLFQALLEAITAHTAGLMERWSGVLESALTGADVVGAMAGQTDGAVSNPPETARAQAMPDPRDQAPPPVGELVPGQWRALRSLEVEVTVRTYLREEECTRFCAGGTVTTRDGVSFDLRFDLTMAREYEAVTESYRRETVEFTDPLVINFDGTSAELTAEKYAFDLDADGSEEWISFVEAGSALLALDRNHDGEVNDGTELFGALSGNGFAELAAYDSDGNGFIDAADPVFDALQLWHRQGGEDRFESLAERNLGAIYLGATATPFELKDEHNQSLGRVRASGIYLEESGAVGSIQQIDLAV